MHKDYADEIALLAKAPAQAETLLHSPERAAAGIGLHVNAHKTEYMCLDLNPQHLATVPQFSHADYSQQMEYSKTLYKLTSHQLFHSNTRLSK